MKHCEKLNPANTMIFGQQHRGLIVKDAGRLLMIWLISWYWKNNHGKTRWRRNWPRMEWDAVMRLISVGLTIESVQDQSKTVSRRLGFERLKVGEILQPVRKCMGLQKRRSNREDWMPNKSA
jgi:hypothetical protein